MSVTTYENGGGEWPVGVSDDPPKYLSPIRENRALTAAELVALATAPKLGLAGRLQALERDRFQQKMNEGIDVARQRLLIRELAKQVPDREFPVDQLAEYKNPTAEARPRTAPGSKGETDISGLRPADIAWLSLMAQRDPATVSAPEAQHLAMLTASARACTNVDPGASDSFLAEAVFAPVKRHFDIAEIEYELEKLQKADDYLRTDSTFSDVLTDAIRAEVPQLTYGEAILRANQMIDTAEEKRDAVHNNRVAELRARLAELRAG